MTQELRCILNELVEKARNNLQHEALYDLVGKVNQSDEIKDYLKELVNDGYIKNINVMGHTIFSCIVTEKGFKEFV